MKRSELFRLFCLGHINLRTTRDATLKMPSPVVSTSLRPQRSDSAPADNRKDAKRTRYAVINDVFGLNLGAA